MAGFAEHEPRQVIGAEMRDDGIELDGEARFGKQVVELAEDLGRRADGGGVFPQARGHLAQDAMDFAQFLFVEAHEVVVELDGFDRFEEGRAAATTGSVDDAWDWVLGAGDDRDDEAIVANGDEFLLQNAVFAMGSDEAVE